MNRQLVIRDGLNYRFQAILNFLDHLTFVAAFDLVASLVHEFDRDLLSIYESDLPKAGYIFHLAY